MHVEGPINNYIQALPPPAVFPVKRAGLPRLGGRACSDHLLQANSLCWLVALWNCIAPLQYALLPQWRLPAAVAALPATASVSRTGLLFPQHTPEEIFHITSIASIGLCMHPEAARHSSHAWMLGDGRGLVEL